MIEVLLERECEEAAKKINKGRMAPYSFYNQ
jgi:hypothetical protein